MNGKLRFPAPITGVIVLVWLAGLMGIYFIGHGKNGLLHAGLVLLLNSVHLLRVSPTFFQLCGGRLIDLCTLSLLLASAWCVGLAVLRGLRWASSTQTLSHLLAIAVGLGLWAWFVLMAGLAGLIAPLLYLVPALLSLVLAVWHWPWLEKNRQEFPRAPRERFSTIEWFLIACLGFGFVLNLIPAFAPEVEYDTLEYHLGALKEYQKAGRIFFLPCNFYASMPSLTEMLYLWGITLRSSTVAKLIHGSFALLTALGMISFGKRLHSRRVGLTAAALYYLLPFVTDLADTARIDLATTFFAFLAGAALHRHLFEEKREFLWLAAIAAGLTLATKYTAGPVVLLPLLVILFLYRRKGEASLAPTLGFLALAVLPVLPWLIKNWVFTGNPVYPIANGIFNSPYWDAVRAAQFHDHHAPTFNTGQAWASLLTSVWTYSIKASFSSPIIILFAPLFLLLSKPERRWKFCAWLGVLIYVCWWSFTFRPWRFLFPAFPWFALLGAMAIVSLEKERATGFLVRVTMGIMLVFNLNYSFLLNAVDVTDAEKFPPQINRLAVFFGRISGAEYLSNIYFTQGWMNGHLPDNACVLYVGEARAYYSRHRVLVNTVYDRSIVGEMVARSKTPDDLLNEMKAGGVTHIYLNKDELDRLGRNYGYLKEMNWPLFNEFLNSHTRIIYRNSAHTVYEITAQEPAST